MPIIITSSQQQRQIRSRITHYNTTACLTMAFGIANRPEPPSLEGGDPIVWVATAGIASGVALATAAGILCGTNGDGDGTEAGVDDVVLDPGHSAIHFVNVMTAASITALMVGSTEDLTIRSEQWNPFPTKMGCEAVDPRLWKSLETVASRHGSSANMCSVIKLGVSKEDIIEERARRTFAIGKKQPIQIHVPTLELGIRDGYFRGRGFRESFGEHLATLALWTLWRREEKP